MTPRPTLTQFSYPPVLLRTVGVRPFAFARACACACALWLWLCLGWHAACDEPWRAMNRVGKNGALAVAAYSALVLVLAEHEGVHGRTSPHAQASPAASHLR